LNQTFGQYYQSCIGLDHIMKILEWIWIAKISDLFNTNKVPNTYQQGPGAQSRTSNNFGRPELGRKFELWFHSPAYIPISLLCIPFKILKRLI